MSAAKHVKEIGPQMEWFSVEDHDGKVWRYQRVAALDLAEPTQVERTTRAAADPGRPGRDDDGHVMPTARARCRGRVVEHVDDPHGRHTPLGISPKGVR
jgi:hypothetical protein